MSKNKINFLLISVAVFKIIYLLIGEYIYEPMVGLGDSHRYLMSSLLNTINNPYLSSTWLSDFFGGIFGLLPSPIYHIPIAILNFLSIKYFINVLDEKNIIASKFDYYILILSLNLPTFGIFSSTYGKEAIITTILFFLVANIISGKFFTYFRFNIILICFAALFKIIYIPFILLFIYVSRKSFVRANIGYRVSVALLVAFIISFVIYSLSELLGDKFVSLYAHFDTPTATSTRENIYYGGFDFILNFPVSSYYSIIGVSLEESLIRPILFPMFVEGILWITIFYAAFFSKIIIFFRLRINFARLIYSIIFFFILLFGHSMIGYFNPGSGIRYRANLLPLILGFYFLYNYINVVSVRVRSYK